jgi:hypothetical protein
MSQSVEVRSIALWTKGYNDLQSWLKGEPDERIDLPAATLLPLRARGRASLLTRMMAEVVQQVLQESGTRPSDLPLITASANGEIQITEQLLEMMNSQKGVLSPARFQNSVHNAAAGQLCIATENRLYSTALSAGQDTLFAALIEAVAWLGVEGGETVVAVAEESPISCLNPDRDYPPLAYAFHLAADRGADQAYGRLSTGPLSEPISEPERIDLSGKIRNNPCAIGLTLMESIARTKSLLIPFSASEESSWCLKYEAYEINP